MQCAVGEAMHVNKVLTRYLRSLMFFITSAMRIKFLRVQTVWMYMSVSMKATAVISLSLNCQMYI